jgi:hypothetical protein
MIGALLSLFSRRCKECGQPSKLQYCDNCCLKLWPLEERFKTVPCERCGVQCWGLVGLCQPCSRDKSTEDWYRKEGLPFPEHKRGQHLKTTTAITGQKQEGNQHASS